MYLFVIAIVVFIVALSIYFESQGDDMYTARGNASMIFWAISIIIAPIIYILFRLKMKITLKSKDDSIPDEEE